MMLKNLFAKAFELLAWRASKSIAYDEVFGAIGDAALPSARAAAASPLQFRAADADAYFKDVFAGSAF